jgi:hypothetical protein
MEVYRGVDLNLQFTNSLSKDFEVDSEVDSTRVRGRLRLLPKQNMTMNVTTEYNTSDSKFAEGRNISTETVLGSLDFNWDISRRLDLFLDMDYIKSKSAGTRTEDLSYLLNLIWAMNDKLTFFLGYRGGQEEEEIASFRTQAKFPFIWDTKMSVNFEIEEGEESDGQFLFIELTKLF